VHRCRTTGCTPAAGETSGAADPDPDRILADRAESGRPDGPLPHGHAATTARELTTRIHRRAGAVAASRPGRADPDSGVDTVTVLTVGIPVP
jgi:hypothetical protein